MPLNAQIAAEHVGISALMLLEGLQLGEIML
jgi:hypothetical protein